jgi:hypothetical protein
MCMIKPYYLSRLSSAFLEDFTTFVDTREKMKRTKKVNCCKSITWILSSFALSYLIRISSFQTLAQFALGLYSNLNQTWALNPFLSSKMTKMVGWDFYSRIQTRKSFSSK